MASLAFSSGAPDSLFPPDKVSVVRSFDLAPPPAQPASLASRRSFSLAGLKADWHPDEDVLFASGVDVAAPLAPELAAPVKLAPMQPVEATPAAPSRMTFEAVAPKPGDSLRVLAQREGCLPELLALINEVDDLDAPLPSDESLEVYRGPVQVHRTRKGDTLWALTRRHRIPLRELLWFNRLRTLQLTVGKDLYIPATELSPALVRRATSDLTTSVLITRARRQMSGEDKARASATRGVVVSRPVQGKITSGYGWRRHPILKRSSFHRGVDIQAPEGTLIRSFQPGKVVFAGDAGPGGKSVILRHADNVYSIYAHCAQIHVTKGDEVPAGTGIARVGATGRATAPHLHFAMKRGATAIDPLPFIR